MPGANDIDSLKFSIVIDSQKFENEMKRVEKLAKNFEESVTKALSVTKLLDMAQTEGAKAAKEKAKAEKEVVLLTRQELEAKKASGTITDKELKQLNAIIRADKALLDEDNKRLTAQKKQLDIENKTLSLQKKKEDAERRHAAAVNATNAKVESQFVLLRQINSYLGTYLSLYGGIRLVESIVRITGEFEAQRAALRAILQDASSADRIFYQLQELAVKSPYTFRDLTSYAKQLSAFSVPMNEIYDTTKKLADVSAGLGVDMSRIILAYGQVRSAAFLRGQEVRQFTEAGIPILAELAKQFEEIEGHAVSTGEVFDRISKRQVPFEMVEEAFRRMTSEGGKFYNMQEVLAETVKGKVSNLQDAWEIMLSKIGDANSGLIKGSLNLVTELIKNYEKLGKVILEVAAAYGTYKAVLATTNTLQAAAAVSTRFLAMTGSQVSVLEVVMHRLFRTTKNGLAKIGGFIAKNQYAIAIAAVVAGVTALILHLRELNAHIRETDKITSKAIAQAEESKSNIHYYIEEMKRAKNGTEEYNKARQEVINQSGNFISAADAERLSLENVDEVWVNICNHIEEATKLQAMQSVTADASATKQASQLKIMEDLADYQRRHELSKEEFNFVAAYIRGEKSYGDLYNNPVSQKGRLFQRAVAWKKDFDAAEGIYEETISRAKQNLDGLYGSGTAPAQQALRPLEGWRKRVDDYIKAFGGGDRGMRVDNSTDLASYIKKGAEALNDARDALKHTPMNDADYNSIKDRIRFYEGISEVIYGKGRTEFDNTTKQVKSQSKEADEARREQIASLKQYFQDLKELKAAYDRLVKLNFGDEEANSILTLFFGRGIPSGGFKSAFEEIAVQMEGLGDGNTARDIRNFADGKDFGTFADGVENAQKSLKKFIETMQDWANKNQEVFGEGAAFNVSNAIANYKKAIDDATNNGKQALSQLFGGATSSTELFAGSTRINNEWLRAKARAGVILRKEIIKYADDILNEQLEKGGYDLTNWNDKTLEQIDAIKDAINGAKIPKDVEDAILMLENGPALLKDLNDELDRLKNRKIGNTIDPERFKKIAKQAKYIAERFLSVANSLKAFADASGNQALSDTASAVGAIAQNIKSAKEGYEAWGGWWGAVIGGVSDLLIQITDGATESQNALNALRDSIREIRIEAQSARFDDLLSGGVDTIFGENFIKQIKNALGGIEELKKGITDLEAARRSFFEWMLKEDGTVKEYSGKRGPRIWFSDEEIAEKLAKYETPEVGAMKFITDHSWLNGNTYKSLADIAEEFNMEMTDANGNLNPKLLQKILDTYGDLNEGAKEWLSEATAYAEKYDKAMKQIEDATKSVFDSLASDMTDQFIDNFLAMGDAVDDLSDTFANLGDAILRSFLQSYVLDEILGKYEEVAKNKLKSYAKGEMTPEDYAAWLDGFAQDVQRESETLAPAINSMIEAFKDRGLMNVDEDTANSLGSGIKGITEDTANLLASYLNAIRADVSYMRVMEEKGWGGVATVAENVPTLVEYMSEVSANTHDIAQDTNRILAELQSVIGAPGTSGMVVRVETY